MIQRIQSVYLMLLIAFFAPVFFFPLLRVEVSDIAGIFDYGITGLQPSEGIEGSMLTSTRVIGFFATFICGITLFTILSFKNRTLQLKLCRSLLFLSVLFTATLLYYPEFELSKLFPGKRLSIHYTWATYLPILAAICTFFAGKAIQRDEDLVRAADRLR